VGVCEQAYWCWNFREVPISAFIECMNGPGAWLNEHPYPLFCAMFDADGDYDVDLFDYTFMLPKDVE